MNKKAFSFVEIIISISILVVLAIVATTATSNIKNNSNNSRVIADLATIKNGFISYSNEGATLADPQGNKNFYTQDWSYAHDRSEAFWVYWKVTENTIENRYLNIVPLDPRTNQYYSYWVAIDSNQFEVAWVLFNEEWHRAKVEGNYSAENWIYNLIREHNWNNFVIDKWPYLPYNPEERILTARDWDWNVYYVWDEIVNNSSYNMEIYFSDWSTSVITPSTSIVLAEMDFPKDNNLVSKVKIFLEAGSIWTQATSLDNESSFDIFTSDTTASVRWTIFAVNTDGTNTEVLVEKWEVEVKKNPILFIKEDILVKPSIISNQVESIKTDISIDPFQIIKDDTDFTKVKKINMTNPNSIIESEIEEVKNVYFSNWSFNTNILDNNLISNIDNSFIAENNINNIWKSCYLEWVKIEDWETWTGFLYKEDDTCTDYITRTCNNWILEWDSNYKFFWCKKPEKCSTSYTNSLNIWLETYNFNLWFWELNTNKWDLTSWVLSEPKFNISNWHKRLQMDLECANDLTYTPIWAPTEIIYCDTWYEEDDWACVSVCNWLQLWLWALWSVCIQPIQLFHDNWYDLVSYIWYDNFNENTANNNDWFNSSFNIIWDWSLYNWTQVMYWSNRWIPEYTWIFNTPNWWCSHHCWIWIKPSSINWLSFNNKNHIIKDTNPSNWPVYWVYLDRAGNDSYLKYEWLNLWNTDVDDFKIEISTRWRSLKSNNANKYYLFSNDSWNVNLFLKDWRLYYYDGISHNMITNSLSIDNHEYYKVVFERYYNQQAHNNSHYTKLSILDKDNNVIASQNNSWVNSWTNRFWSKIYIASDKNKSNQWEDIIDYVKIYKKDM